MFDVEQNTPNHLKIGQIGENMVTQRLLKEGHHIVERNYLKPYGEIDIVTSKDQILHFVEVKALSGDVPRGTSQAFLPQDHMNYGKQQRQKRVIETYLAERKVGEQADWQIDLACVYLDREGKLIELEFSEDITLA